MRREDGFGGMLFICLHRRIGHVVRPHRVRLGADHGPEQFTHAVQQGLVAAGGAVEVNRQTALVPDALLLSAEDGYVRPAEAVDGLAHVTNDEQAAGFPGQGAYNSALALVGVLELVHQDGLQLGLPAGTDLWIIQQAPGEALQIVKIERLAGRQEVEIGLLNLFKGILQQGQQLF